MKDLRHLFLSTFEIGVNLTLTERFMCVDGGKDSAAFMTMGLRPNNIEKVVCPYLLISLRRIAPAEVNTVDKVYVVGHVFPATVEEIRNEDGSMRSEDVGYYNVFMVHHHCGDKLKIFRMRKNYIGKFVSVQQNGHATKGGVYGSSVLCGEYVGIFKNMPEMYSAIRSIYQDL